MSFNGSGTFVINSAGQPVSANTLIEAAVFNAFTADVATGLSTAITKDGQTTVTANLPMAGYRLTGLGAGSANGHSLRYEQLFSTSAITLLGAMNWVKGADIASATTINLTTATGNAVHVTGTTQIDAVTLGSGMWRMVIFDGILTLAHSATNNNLPGGANITTAANDRALYWSDGTTVYCISYITAAAINLLKSGGTMTGDLTMSGASIIEAEGASVASAASCNIWATDGNTVHITGTTQIDDFATAPQAGAWMKVVFDDALILNQSANLNLNGGGADITTAAGDMAFVYADTTTQMDVFVIRKSGAAVVAPAATGTLTAGTPLVQNPYTNSATVTQAHGLGVDPTFFKVELECLTAEGNWSIGDKIKLSASNSLDGNNATNFGWAVTSDATNTIFINGVTAMFITNKTTYGFFQITPANWKVTITPYKLN